MTHCPHNSIDCPCTKEGCPRHGHCCECVAHHKAHGTKLPACLRGIDWQEDFGFEFSKDLQRDMNRFYEKHHRIPTSEEYKVLTECHLYPYLDAA